MTPEELQKLKDQRDAAYSKIEELRKKNSDSDKEWTAEDEQEWTRCNTDYDNCDGRIKRETQFGQLAEGRTRTDGRIVGNGSTAPDHTDDENDARDRGRRKPDSRDEIPDGEARSIALAAFCRSQAGFSLNEREQQACEQIGFNPSVRQIEMSWLDSESFRSLQRCWETHPHKRSMHQAERVETRAPLATTSVPSAGFMIDPIFLRRLEINMLEFGGMRQAAETMTTAQGGEVSWPTIDDTGNTGRIVAEGANVDNAGAGGAVPAGKLTTWGAHKYTSDAVLVNYEMLQDSAFNLASILGQMLGERIGRITNDHFTTGTGVGQPTGILTAINARAVAADRGIIAAAQNVIDYDEIIDLEHAVDKSYRGNAGYMMNDVVVAAVRKLKDGNGDYLWQRGIDNDRPDQLNGHTLYVNQSMTDTIEAGEDVMVFGQLSSYKIRRVAAFRFYRLVERYRSEDQDGFVVFLREDGNLLDSGTPRVKRLQMAA